MAEVAARRELVHTVKVNVAGYMRFGSLLGDQLSLELETENATLGDALKVLCTQYGEALASILFDPDTKEIRGSNLILLNGQAHSILGKRLDTELKDGDEITLGPMIAGG